jgi:hypothetical protein
LLPSHFVPCYLHQHPSNWQILICLVLWITVRQIVINIVMLAFMI